MALEISTTFNRPTLLVITGPTAVGKTELTIRLAQQFNAPILSADSRQFYREMKIGTACPTDEELRQAAHYFIGNLSIGDYYSVSKYEQDVLQLLPTLFQNGNVVIMTGGSGLYIDAVTKGIDQLPDPDPEIRQQVIDLYENEGIEALRRQLRILDPTFIQNTDIANYKRLIRALEVCLQTGLPYSQQLGGEIKKRNFDIVKYCLVRPREVLFNRINRRVDQMVANGLIDEARGLYQYKHLNALNTVGYKEIFDYLDQKLTLEQAIEDIKTHTRRYAKRQMTWFKRDGGYTYVDLGE